MKKTFLLINALVCVFLSGSVAHAQLHVYRDGRIMVGNTNHPYDDLGRVLKLSIQGDDGYFNAGAKLGFGDFGLKDHIGWNVFIGEWGEYDSDILWLHGKNGIRMTTWDGSYTIMEWGCDNSNISNFIVYDPVNTDRLSFSSDRRFMSNIQQTNHALERLLQLHSLRYIYHSPYTNTPVTLSQDMSDKEYDDALRMQQAMDASNHTSVRYGLFVDEVYQQFPEIVTQDANGVQYINYVEMIPLLIAAMQEMYHVAGRQGINLMPDESYYSQFQSSFTDSMPSSLIPNLTNRLSRQDSNDEARLFQNSPNPFIEQTEIRYYVPLNASSASIFIFTLDGRLRKTINLTSFGSGVMTIDNTLLEPGMYLYTLVVDEQIIDNKQMILTQ